MALCVRECMHADVIVAEACLFHADVYMPTMVACGSMTVSTALGCKSACSLEMRRACFASHAAISCPPWACAASTQL